jgi:hypothetical protein
MLKSRWAAVAFFSLLVLAGSRVAFAYYDSVGPVDMVRYCLSAFGQNYAPVQFAAGRDGWACQNPVGERRSMNLRRACEAQHNEDERHITALWDGGRWICAYIFSEQPVDLSLYCKKHFGSAWGAVLHGGTPYDWSCQRGSNASDRKPISVKAACTEQWNFNHVYKAIPGPGTNWTCLLRPA